MCRLSELIREYREKGAEPFKARLPDLIATAEADEATRGFRYFCADVCMDLKDFASAIRVLRTQERTFGLSDIGYNNLGYCLWELDDHGHAYIAFQQSLQLNPNNVSSLRGAAYCALRCEKPDSVELARQFYQQSGCTSEAALWYITALYYVREDAAIREILRQRESEFGIEECLSDFWKEFPS